MPTSPQDDIAGVWCHTQLPPIAAVESSSGTSVCVADTSAAEPFPHETFVAPTKVGRYSSGGQIDAWLQSEVFMAVFQTKKSSWRSVL